MLLPFINWFLIDLIMGAVAAEEEVGLQLQANRLRASHPPSEDLQGSRRPQAALRENHLPGDRPHGAPAADPFWRATYFGRHGR